ncbi:MAG TPA: SOS response-associated peptidase [Gammaproteobacteria bacterium]|nr:SOS response-associated peptidase [Gammaproteobacteria bacterium]
MCGRYSLSSSSNSLEEHFNLVHSVAYRPRYNITPGTLVPVIKLVDGKRVMANHYWGLVPHWASDTKLQPINARSDAVDQKPFFRSAFRKSRCLVPANGFYEWQRTEEKRKQPYYSRLPDSEILAFAGLHEHWEKDGRVIDSCAIITTDANKTMAKIHSRMPVILKPADYDNWLETGSKALLQPYAGEMLAYEVSTAVNNPKNDDRSLLEPVS